MTGKYAGTPLSIGEHYGRVREVGEYYRGELGRWGSIIGESQGGGGVL